MEADTKHLTIGDLITISRTPAVVSLAEVEAVRDRLAAGGDAREALAGLLTDYSLGEEQTRLAFEAMVRSLGRPEPRGDAFAVAGVYGSGKSHLLAALTLLCGHPTQAWPAFLDSHPSYRRAAAEFARPRLVVTVPLEAYPAATYPLEQVVFSRLEQELAQRHGVRVALTEEAHLLQLVEEYVRPQHHAGLDAAARGDWSALREADPPEAARIALEFLAEIDFPLDWRRSRAEAWGVLRGALRAHDLDGPVLLLDELGLFLAAKDRKGLNADASFLQYLAQLCSVERGWVICATQRGLQEAGDIDRRTLRQMRDRFRAAFALDLSEFGWVLEHKLVRRREPETFPREIDRLHAQYGTVAFTAEELRHTYPLNPLCAVAAQRAAEAALSRTRSIVRLLQEAALERGWLDLPAARLLTPDVVFDLVQEELAYSVEGRRAREAVAAVTAEAGLLAPGREGQLAVVVKALGLLALSGMRWSLGQLRSSLAGGAERALWERPEAVRELLVTLYRRGLYVERVRREGEEADAYYLDLDSGAGERIRQRLGELRAEMGPDDSRAWRAALEVCTDTAFPLAALLETRSAGVEWQHARRYVSVSCRDLTALSGPDAQNAVGALASPQVREDGLLFIAAPQRIEEQRRAWVEVSRPLAGRFAGACLAWLPRPLGPEEADHLLEHAALARMVADSTLVRRRDVEMREKLRARWEESERELRATVRRCYAEGSIVGAGGKTRVEPERLAALSGDWEGTLGTAFAAAFEQLFPRFAEIAPGRRLAGRAQTNQIIDQFIRPGEVSLPPASALEAHLLAYARPLGLAEGEERAFRLALQNRRLVEEALALTPARTHADTVEAEEAIAFGELAGRLAKSEWGITREQSELLIAALVRLGSLVALDAFLQPVRLDAVAAPLSDFLPYVARGAALGEAETARAQALHAAATGASVATWDLPAQERVWGELLAWSRQTIEHAESRRAAVVRTAQTLGHAPEAWASLLLFQARAEAVAQGVEATATSRAGLIKLVEAAARLPGGVEASAEAIARWRRCDRVLAEEGAELAQVHRVLSDARIVCPADSLLARMRREALARFASPEQLLEESARLKVEAQRWWESYRRHYLAWHEQAHAPARFAELLAVREAPALEAARRLARAGAEAAGLTELQARLSAALAQRCLAGDPLPAGCVVCPLCGLSLGQPNAAPEGAQLRSELEALLARQLAGLRAQRELLVRRLSAAEAPLQAALSRLLEESVGEEELRELLTERVVLWLSQQLAHPCATQREWRALEERLKGRELSRREVLRAVEEWLGGEDEVVEIV